MSLALVEGPFRLLDGLRAFGALGDRGTKIKSALAIRFEFKNPITAMLLSRSFEKTCADLVDVFVLRARAVYVWIRSSRFRSSMPCRIGRCAREARRCRRVRRWAMRCGCQLVEPLSQRSRGRPLHCAIFGRVVALDQVVAAGVSR